MQFATVLKPELAARYRAGGLWLNKNFFDVIDERDRAHPDREVFAELDGDDVATLDADVTEKLGIERGDVVTVQLPNRIAFPVVFFALELIGAVANKVNPDFRARELEYILKFSGSRAYVCPREFKGFDYVAMAKALRSAVPAVTHVVVADGSAEGAFDLDAGIAKSPPISAADRVKMSPDEVFRMAFTSGTTGDPKCVLHSFNTTLCTVKLLNEDMLVTDRDVMLIYLPVGLNWGYICLMQTIMAGGGVRCCWSDFPRGRRSKRSSARRSRSSRPRPPRSSPCSTTPSWKDSTSPRCASSLLAERRPQSRRSANSANA